MASVSERQQRLAVIVVGYIMAVSVHGPVEVLLEAVRMPVIGYHFKVILDRLEYGRRMGRARHDGPDYQR